MILDHIFPPDIRVENEALSLIKTGHEVFILCYAGKANSKIEKSFKGIILQKIHTIMPLVRKLRALTNTLLNIYPYYWAMHIKKLVKKYELDVLHVHDLYMLKAAFIANKQFHLPIIADLHENYAEGLKNYKFAKSLFGRIFISIKKWQKTEIEWCLKADKIITVIDEAKDRYTQSGIPRDKIYIVANYVNRNEFLNVDDYPEIKHRFKSKFVLTYIGGFDHHRGLENVIKAIPELNQHIKNLCVVLVGAGRNLQELKDLVRDLKIESYIAFEGYQPQCILPAYIKTSDICLIPHLKTIHTDNTIPHKLFHYMLLGKPVVASNCTPIQRIIDDSKCGLIYESQNSTQLAKQILTLYNNPELLTQMGKAGIKAVNEKFNWDETSTNLITLYRSLENQKISDPNLRREN